MRKNICLTNPQTMKPFVILSLAVGVLATSQVNAQVRVNDKARANYMERNQQVVNDNQLNNAIRLRQRNYMMEKIRDNNRKNIKNQWLRHTLHKAESGVDTVNTIANRSGELKDAPYYAERRATTNTAISAPNNAKRNFRTRAYDYYIDGGDAGTEVLEQDVIISSEHEVPTRRDFHTKNQANAADIISALRTMQKERRATNQVPTLEQKTTFRTGDSQRNFLHPFMNFNLEN